MISNTVRFIATALEPVHVGAGNERLGHVDMSVIRDVTTHVPYLPSTGISGATKSYADIDLRANSLVAKPDISAAGNSGKGLPRTHPIISAFGYTPNNDPENASRQSFKGIIDFEDAHLLAFPVNTFIGPIWITTVGRLHQALALTDGFDNYDDTYQLPDGASISNPLGSQLNFGWCVLGMSTSPSQCPSVAELEAAGLSRVVASRLAVVSEWLFPNLVNDSMVTRTSVVIDPETGAAAEHLLFTYEAVPRGALFYFSLTEFDFDARWPKIDWPAGEPPASATALAVTYGFPGMRHMGIGGMSTRGFGRLDIQQITSGEGV